MPGLPPSISMFPSGPLAADRLAAIAAAEVHEQHWLALALATRLVRGPFPTAQAIELDVNQFAAGEGSLNLVRVFDQDGRTLWDLLWLDDDVAWTTTEGRDWSEVRGEIASELGEIFYHLGFPGSGDARGWRRVPQTLLTYRRMLAEPDVLTGRWRYVPRLSAAADHLALRDCMTCRSSGLVHAAATRPCVCVRRFDAATGEIAP
jgi:hypothetical protein